MTARQLLDRLEGLNVPDDDVGIERAAPYQAIGHAQAEDLAGVNLECCRMTERVVLCIQPDQFSLSPGLSLLRLSSQSSVPPVARREYRYPKQSTLA